MGISQLLRIFLIIMLVSFTASAGAACQPLDAVPAASHASDCNDMAGMDDEGPRQKTDKTTASNCAIGCLTIADFDGCAFGLPHMTVAKLMPAGFTPIDGNGAAPPVPPPRSFLQQN